MLRLGGGVGVTESVIDGGSGFRFNGLSLASAQAEHTNDDQFAGKESSHGSIFEFTMQNYKKSAKLADTFLTYIAQSIENMMEIAYLGAFPTILIE